MHILSDPVTDFWNYTKQVFFKNYFIKNFFDREGDLIGLTKIQYKHLKFCMWPIGQFFCGIYVDLLYLKQEV